MQAIQNMTQAVRDRLFPHLKMQVEKRQTRYNYRNGPMYYLGQQIVKAMEDAGYPAFIHCCYRPPEEQQAAFDRKASKARPFQSPHQYWEAVDIVHPSLFWNAPPDYWEALHDCARVVEERFGVTFEHGFLWGWDSAHIELKDWRNIREKLGNKSPTEAQLDRRFREVLPDQWKQYERSAQAQRNVAR